MGPFGSLSSTGVCTTRGRRKRRSPNGSVLGEPTPVGLSKTESRIFRGWQSRKMVETPATDEPSSEARWSYSLPNVTRQELSELREGHVLRDETRTATGEAVIRPLSNDAPARVYRLDVAPTALLARRLNGDR